MMIATVSTRLRHMVRLVHASTGIPLQGLRAQLEPALYGWSLRVLPDTVVVSVRTDVAPPPVPPKLVVTLTDGAVANLLVIPPLAERPPRTIVVDLTADEVDVSLQPVELTLTVVLTSPSTGTPRTAATVTARATSGPSPKPVIALPEVEPGTYRSAPALWTAAFVPLDLLVDGSLLRTLHMNFMTSATRTHLVDTT
ncbi:hypothetical protein NIBR502772_11050 [Pseudarthrobacter sp. NIBRBAC000502772]|uniref:hypothetical protein n=1 Tax=Pseudarthrobacter sp. NIBRBAC000502772 TaxID=2590775 RepID=UPI00112FEC09|nr:hypothetical protein [Pseudarthrobacter sp. NIBRBAC000502772]QDG66669.1 hypothetical protein NIBR502772_11050 [Pseudarthrobacter sp. NIBRBAC000502772]